MTRQSGFDLGPDRVCNAGETATEVEPGLVVGFCSDQAAHRKSWGIIVIARQGISRLQESKIPIYQILRGMRCKVPL
jgi:hypothetical protein